MKKLPLIVAFFSILIVMEGISWLAFRTSDDTALLPSELSAETAAIPSDDPAREGERIKSVAPSPVADVAAQTGSNDTAGFPGPTTETVNGRVERTIHMGVRQWQWDPSALAAKQGELVRLIIHNADVLHGLVIPELGVNQDIPPDGAVVEFIASKAGSFEFFCSIWCGEGHMEMRGRLVVEQ